MYIRMQPKTNGYVTTACTTAATSRNKSDTILAARPMFRFGLCCAVSSEGGV